MWGPTLASVLFMAAVASTGVMALDVKDELHMGWNMGLLPRQSQNLNTFDGSLGGVKAPAITESKNPQRPYQVDGDTFPDFASAASRACDNQQVKCSQVANNGPDKFPVLECAKQLEQCRKALLSSARQNFGEPVYVATEGDYDIYCDP